MVSLNHKKTSKGRAVKRILDKYEKEDYDTNKSSKELLEKVICKIIEENPYVNLDADVIIKDFKKKYPNEV